MQAYICSGCDDAPCYYLLIDDVIDDPDTCPFNDLVDWQPIDIKDIVDVLEAEQCV